MPEIEMLCMANSWKKGGRCIAGLLYGETKEGAWIRPVSTRAGGAISEEQCKLRVESKPGARRGIRPLDIVRLKIQKPTPLGRQPENLLIANKPWRLSRRAQLDDIADFLTSHEYNRGPLFGTLDDRVSWKRIQKHGVKESLILLRAPHPTFYWKPRRDKGPQHRVTFEHAGTEYDLSVTFELETGEDGDRSSSDWWLTISLSDPLPSQDNACFKLIAGAIRVP